MAEEARHRYGRVESRHVSEWAPLNTEPFICSLPADEYPLREESASGHPKPSTSIERSCKACGASFLGLAAGKTGERGIWDDWHWYCSVECAEKQP